MEKILIITALVMLLTAVISTKCQDRSGAVLHTELKDLVYEAQIAREDLEAMLQNVQVASEEVVQTMNEALISRYEQLDNPMAAGGSTKIDGHEMPILPFAKEDMQKAHPYLMATRLKEMGYSNLQIAEYLNRSSQEVELILSIADKKQKIS